MRTTSFKIDSFIIQIYAADRKGRRTRWGDKLIKIYSEGREVAQAVFAREGTEVPEPYFSEGKIHFFAESGLFPSVINLLQTVKPVYIAWKPVYDPKEPQDGDAYFSTEEIKHDNHSSPSVTENKENA
ncbi:MAG: hypothetical protein ACE5L7_10680 [Candidatus Aminicenantales bacterium]